MWKFHIESIQYELFYQWTLGERKQSLLMHLIENKVAIKLTIISLHICCLLTKWNQLLNQALVEVNLVRNFHHKFIPFHAKVLYLYPIITLETNREKMLNFTILLRIVSTLQAIPLYIYLSCYFFEVSC